MRRFRGGAAVAPLAAQPEERRRASHLPQCELDVLARDLGRSLGAEIAFFFACEDATLGDVVAVSGVDRSARRASAAEERFAARALAAPASTPAGPAGVMLAGCSTRPRV